jgi:hypothetical protein
MQLKSRILKFINNDLMTKLNSIALDVLIPDNNTKMNLFIAAFEEYDVPYQELGPGTNRGAFLIDGYVFKNSLSLINGKFIGLAIDYKNDKDWQARADRWIESIKSEF